MNLARAELELPIRIRGDRPISDEELMRLSAQNEPMRFEREPNGDVLVITPSGNRTGRMNAHILQTLGVWAESDGRGYFFDSSTGFTLPDGSVRSPDAAWLLKPRWDALSEDDKDRFSPIVPDFVIELRSPTDKLSDLEPKMQMWIANGAEVAWLIDPIEKTVTVYRPGADPERLMDPTSVQGTGPIAGFELIMQRVWG